MGTPLERLAQRVKQRRLELHLDIEPTVREIGMSKDTWSKVEGSPTREPQRVRPTTYARIDEVLLWAHGSCLEILEGREPIPIAAGEGGLMASIPSEALEEDIRQSVTNATIATAPDMTAREITALNARIMDELRKKGILPPAGE